MIVVRKVSARVPRAVGDWTATIIRRARPAARSAVVHVTTKDPWAVVPEVMLAHPRARSISNRSLANLLTLL